MNHKAVYGKNLKKSKDWAPYSGDDETLKNLSPRSREIVTVMRMIKSCNQFCFIIFSFREDQRATSDHYRLLSHWKNARPRSLRKGKSGYAQARKEACRHKVA